MKLASVIDLKRQLRAEMAEVLDAETARAAELQTASWIGTAAAKRVAGQFELATPSDSPGLFGVMQRQAHQQMQQQGPAISLRAAAKLPNLAFGIAPGRGRNDFYLGVRVQGRGPVAERLADAARERAPGECDVRIVPKIVARARKAPWFRATRRPLEAGLSVGLAAESDTGTIAAIVEDDRAYYVLSNSHVLGALNKAQRGDPVVQPGGYYRSASERTLIGYVQRFEPVSFTRANRVDCAIAALLCDVEFYAGWNEGIRNRVVGTRPVTRDDLDRPVLKVGSTTGITRGRITQVDVDTLRVDFGPRRSARFEGQFEITGAGGRPFSDEGDSGSLVVEPRSRRALGLFFCGGPDEQGVDLSYANPIDTVLKELGVRLTTR